MTRSNAGAKVVVAGFGSTDRRDDGVGPLVAARAQSMTSATDIGPLGDPLDLLGQWNGVDLVIVVDAVRSGAPTGTVRVIEMDIESDHDPLQSDWAEFETRVTSTHGIGLAGVVRLARAVGQAPKRLIVVGVEGEAFGFGEGLSPGVERAVPEALRRVVELITEV